MYMVYPGNILIDIHHKILDSNCVFCFIVYFKIPRLA